MELAELGEFGLIKRLREKCSHVSYDVLAGIGDDAAAIKISAKKILVTSDMLIEGVHFDLSYMTFYQLGHKLLAVNISDICAMGGEPKYFLVSLGIPKTCRPDDIEDLYSGIRKVAKKFRIDVVGGDTCLSKKGLVLSGTLIGNATRIITRSGAKEGDGIFVTDALGDSAMGLSILKKAKINIETCKLGNANIKMHGETLSCRDVLSLLKKHLMPQPAVLKRTAKLTSMIDISDGLLIDLSHICDESSVGAVIYKEKIPISTQLHNVAKRLRTDPFNFALTGGEDYALLFTAPSNYKTNAFRIGEIIKKGRYIVDSRGRKKTFRPDGYEHFT